MCYFELFLQKISIWHWVPTCLQLFELQKSSIIKARQSTYRRVEIGCKISERNLNICFILCDFGTFVRLQFCSNCCLIELMDVRTPNICFFLSQIRAYTTFVRINVCSKSQYLFLFIWDSRLWDVCSNYICSNWNLFESMLIRKSSKDKFKQKLQHPELFDATFDWIDN